MLKSPYRVTLDPDGTPLVILGYDEDLLTSPFPNRADEGDDLDFAEALNSLPVGRGAAKRTMTIGVRRKFASFAALASAHQALDAAMPSEAFPLKFEAATSTATTGATYEYSAAHLRSISFVPLDNKPLHVLITYTLAVTAPTVAA